MTKREREVHAYLSRLLTHYAPQCEALPDLLGLCSQIDNLLTGILRERDIAQINASALAVWNDKWKARAVKAEAW